MQSALVTGGAGFIGSHVVERLVARRTRVRVLDDLSSGSLNNLAAVAGDIEFLQGSVTDPEACRRASEGVDCVFHLAALVSVADSIERPLHANAVTFGGTLNMLAAARDAGVRRFVLSSSAAVYGNGAHPPVAETSALAPESPYGSDKAAAEFYCRNFADLYGLETVMLRYFNVYGCRQNSASAYAAAVPKFISAVERGQPITIFGDGQQTRDFVHVDDVAAANLLAADGDVRPGRAYNIAAGKSVSILGLAEAIADVVRRPIQIQFEAARAGEVRHSLASIERASADLGFRARVSLSDGIVRMLATPAAASPAMDRQATG